ncbi:MAG: hypothetical protein COV35_05070 [Alphaproteobacteria bacterium CG11_big_fil_rev_8_21_14_0_20_39_49]|nr:MAG: hypothetical protein COV35_05070 [Alphaproteobacteria bacterium CG11_big_fil_rev_8_21_14_0_20_39_49]
MLFIRNSIASLLLYIISATFAVADEFGCKVDYTKFESFIDGSSPDTKVILPPKLYKPKMTDGEVKAGYVEHQVQLKNGVVVKLELGGCKIYGYRIRFENIQNLLESGDINKIMEKVNAVFDSVPFKDEKVMESNRKFINNYVENRTTGQFYELDKERGYIITSPNIEKKCPDYGKSQCGVVLGVDVFEIFNRHMP